MERFESKVKLGITLTKYEKIRLSNKFESKVKLGITLTSPYTTNYTLSLRVK